MRLPWIKQQKGEIKSDFLLAIMFESFNNNFLDKKSSELAVKYKKSKEKMYFEVLKGFVIASGNFEFPLDNEEEDDKSPFLISPEELQKAQGRFKEQTNPVYQKCAEIGIDLGEYEQTIKNSWLPEVIQYTILELTFKLRHHPEIMSEIIDSIPQFWILSETSQFLENRDKQD